MCSLGSFSIGPHPEAFGHGSVPWHRSLGECTPCWMLSNRSEWSLMSLKMQCSVWRCSPGKIAICAREDRTQAYMNKHTRACTYTNARNTHATGFLQLQHTIVLLVKRSGTWSVTLPLGSCVSEDWLSVCVCYKFQFCPHCLHSCLPYISKDWMNTHTHTYIKNNYDKNANIF